MLVSVSLLLLFTGSTVAKKRGDFGIFTVCKIKNDTLRLDCKYADCETSPSFYCEYMMNGSRIAKESNKNCRLPIPANMNEAVNYSCILKRKKRQEVLNITVDFTSAKAQNKIKNCPATTGLQLHRAPALLWPVVSLSLWRVLATDGQTS